jgi:hypothetical protein
MKDSNIQGKLVRVLAGPLDLAVQASVDEGSATADSPGEDRYLKLVLSQDGAERIFVVFCG